MKRSIISLLTIFSLSFAGVQGMEENKQFKAIPNIGEKEKPGKTILINSQYAPYVNKLQSFISYNRMESGIKLQSNLQITQDVQQIFLESLKVIHQIKTRGLDNYLACMGLVAALISQLQENNFTDLLQLIALADYMQVPILINALAVICIKENIDLDVNEFPMSFARAHIRFHYYLNQDMNALVKSSDSYNKSLKTHVKEGVKEEEEEVASDKKNANLIDQFFSFETLIEDGILLIDQEGTNKPDIDDHLLHYPLNTITRHYDKIPSGTVKDSLNKSIQGYTDKLLNNKVKKQNKGAQEYQLSYVSKELQVYPKNIVQLLDCKNQKSSTQSSDLSFDNVFAQYNNFELRKTMLTQMVAWLKEKYFSENSSDNELRGYFKKLSEGYIKMAMRFLYADANNDQLIDQMDINPIRSALILDFEGFIYLQGVFTGSNDPLLVHIMKFIELAKPLYGCDDSEIILHDNQLTSIPAEIGSLTALKALYIQGNKLTSIPAEIRSLTALEFLDLGEGKLTSIPAEIGSLTALKSLELHTNKLRSIPSEIGRLTALTCLNLYNNKLTTIPAEIGKLTALTMLRLDDNYLTTLPTEIGNLTALTDLGLSGNQLTTLPAEIGNLTALTEFSLYNNQLPSAEKQRLRNIFGNRVSI